jgi:transketolase
VSCAVAVCASLAPAPIADLVQLLSRVRVAVTVESHYVTGGLGSLVCEIVAEHGLAVRVTRVGVREMPTGATGSQAYLEARHGLDAQGIAVAAGAALALARLDQVA